MSVGMTQETLRGAALCFAACRAAGGRTEQALLSATALELFHNAFLVHDDVEDGSQFRRGRVTLFQEHGAPVAINVGDATNVLAMELLLGNTSALGVRKALLVFREVERMARESAEGQAIELGWIRSGRFELDDRDYVRMAYKKTCWYTVIAPLRIGVVCGSAPGPLAPLDDELTPLIELGFLAGIAFQIHDDLLNLEADETLYGKETSGDLWEGKRTVMLLHFIRTARGKARTRARKLLATRGVKRLPRTWRGCSRRFARRGRSSTGGGSRSSRSVRSRSTRPGCRSSRRTATGASCVRCCATSSSG